jgi:hypothetical protein
MRMKPRRSPIPESPNPEMTEVEAARYALFGRVLPSLRHALVGELQAMRFGVSLARMGCEGRTPQFEMLGAIARLDEQVGSGIARAEALSSWCQPDGGSTIPVGRGVEECLELVRTEWGVRGIEVSTRLAAGEATVMAWPFREVLAALLVTMGDAQVGPADVTLRLRRRAEDMFVTIRSVAAIRDSEPPRAPWPRRLRWSDVGALAGAHGIDWAHHGQRVIARFPLSEAPDSRPLSRAVSRI